MPPASLHSLVTTLLLVVLALPLEAQVPTTNASAPTDDPFAVLAAKEPQSPERTGQRIVVQRPDGSPAQDAVVVFTPWRDDAAAGDERAAATTRFPGDEPRRFAAMAANGTRYRVDGRGATRVPRDGHLLAFAGELAAHHYVAKNRLDEQLVLHLALPQVVLVEVVTLDGKPAVAVPLAVRDQEDHPALPMGTSGADGTATLRVLPPRPTTGVVQLAIASATPRQAPLPAQGERVRLQMPATTSVAATLAGELVPGSVLDWRLQCAGAVAAFDGEPTDLRSARWPFVELGAAFVVSVRSARLELANATATASESAGPLALVRTPSAATFALQLLAQDGAPLRRHHVSLAWRTKQNSREDFTWTTHEGWIEVAMPAIFLGKKGVELSVELGGDASELELCTGKVAVQATELGRSELPPLRCATAPVLAAGTFVTRDGNPVPGLQLTVRSSSLQRQVTTAAGSFVVRGVGNGHAIQLLLDHDWCAVTGHPWEIALPEGTKDARLVVQRAARVRFATDLRGEFLSRFDYDLEPADGEGASIDLPFSLEQHELLVPPGHWHFVVSQENEELHRLPDLRATSGVEMHDPRFMAFDWRAFAVPVELRVRDAAGQPSDACTVWITSVLGGSGRSPVGGVLRLLLPKHGADLEIAPDDAALPRLPLGIVTKDQVVVLGGGPVLTMRLQPMPKLPEGLELVLATEDRVGVPFDASGLATLRLPKAGEVPPVIRLRRGDDAVAPLPWQLPPVDVPEAGTTFVVELTPDRQRLLDQWIERIRAF